jgi:nicotinamide mononucleotide transporter
MNQTKLSVGGIFKELFDLSTKVQVYLAVLTIVTAWISISWGDPWYATLSTISGVICVVLVAERKISNYVWGIINCALYGLLSYNNHFYGDMTLNWLIYLPFQFIGYYLWSRRIDNTDTVSVQGLSIRQVIAGSVGVCVLITGLTYTLKLVGGANPATDAANTVLSIMATVLMAKCYKEQWLCWIVVNVTGIIMWGEAAYSSSGAGVAGLIMWLAFFVNSCYGYWNWSKKQ